MVTRLKSSADLAHFWSAACDGQALREALPPRWRTAFFAPRKRRASRKLTAEVCQQAQMLLNKGLEVPQGRARVGILANTLRKAIRDGQLVHNI
jgi:hypothetical protein